MDAIDAAILGLVQNDATLSLDEIALQLGPRKPPFGIASNDLKRHYSTRSRDRDPQNRTRGLFFCVG